MIIGYLAEFKLRQLLASDSRITGWRKDDDHDRTKKGDLVITYRDREFIIECKSLQSNSIKRHDDGTLSGKYQCDASDRRKIQLPNRRRVETTCLQFGEFDIVAVPLYGFEKKWNFAFALNNDLQASTYRKYPKAIRRHLIATLQAITLPLKPPYTSDVFHLMDTLIDER